MDEIIQDGKEMLAAGYSVKKVIQTVMDNMLAVRQETDVTYRPYEGYEGAAFAAPLSEIRFQLEKLYPQALNGDGVFVDFCISCRESAEIFLNVRGNIRVWYNRKCIYDSIGGDGNENAHLPVKVRAGSGNEVRILCVKQGGHFSFAMLLSVKRYPSMWANDYLLSVRNMSPVPEREGEEGFAVSGCLTEAVWKSIGGTEPAFGRCKYQWPGKLSCDESFDFNKLCNDGDLCYVYTEAVNTHIFAWSGNVDAVWINGRQISAGGAKRKLMKGDKVLLRCRKQKEGWKVCLDTAHIGLPWVTSNRGKGDRAIYAGPFFDGDPFNADIDFSKIYVNGKGRRLYWGFCDGSELRCYLDSVFYGQWFYALMIGFYGIRSAALFLEDKERLALFNRNMCFMAKYFEYIQYDASKHIMPAFMPRSVLMNNWDNIGTMGMNLIDAYFDCRNDSLLPLIQKIAYESIKQIPVFKDGTYRREDTVWSDDLFMSCPFLLRMGKLTGGRKWYEQAKKQITGFQKRLYIPQERLFSHRFFTDNQHASRIPWGRGNGWVMWALSEYLMYANGVCDIQEELALFRRTAFGILTVQDETGLWRQVLNSRDRASYLETSCTAMFMLAFARGIRFGWLDRKKYLPCLHRAWEGLQKYGIDVRGNIYGVCMGSWCADDPGYYYSIPTIINDDHGTGIILAALSEYGALLNEGG